MILCNQGVLDVIDGGLTACHHLRGGIMGALRAVPACRRHPGRRNTGLRTASTPAGVGEMSASPFALRGVVSTHVRRYLLLILEKIVTLHIDNLRAYFILSIK